MTTTSHVALDSAQAADPKRELIKLIVSHSYEEAHSIRTYNKLKENWAYLPEYRPIGEADLDRHLSGSEASLGGFLRKPGSDQTRLAVLDFDDHKRDHGWEAMVEVARRVLDLLAPSGLHPLAVRSGSGTGIHLFFRFEQPVPARAIRSLLDLVLIHAKLKGRSPGTIRVDLFPTSDVASEKLAGVIALPFGRQSVLLAHPSLNPTTKVPDWPTSTFKGMDNLEGWKVLPPHLEAKPSSGPPPDLDKVRDALKSIPADEYELWLKKVGMAIKSTYPGEDGLELWREWSSQSEKHRPGECEEVWPTLHPRAITIATVFYLAKQAGWSGEHITIEGLNERFAHCIAGNKEVVIEERTDAEGRPNVDLLSVEAFHGIHRGQQFWIKTKKGPKPIPVSRYWLNSLDRRFYRNVDFAPPPLTVGQETYNLYRGWRFEPQPGDVSLFLEHVFENICQGNKEHNDWVIAWLAAIVQKPAIKVGTSLALRGKQGTGKTIVGSIMGHLLWPYYFKASSDHQVTGHFNSHLKNVLLLQAEEAFWAGDKKTEGVLKDLITSDELRVEFKGRDIVRMLNCIRLLVTSNNEWIVPAEYWDRRFTVLDVGDKRRQDHKFFGAMHAQMENGGYPALLHYLLNHQYDEALIRRNLDTEGGQEQKLRSQDHFEKWLIDLLQQGWLPGDREAKGESFMFKIQGAYQHYAKTHHARQVHSNVSLGKAFGKWIPGVISFYRDSKKEGAKKRFWFYRFPPLAQCRSAILQRLPGFKPGWSPTGEWTMDPTIIEEEASEELVEGSEDATPTEGGMPF